MASQRESHGFVGFYGVFLECTKKGSAAGTYRLYFEVSLPLYVVVSGQVEHQSPDFE